MTTNVQTGPPVVGPMASQILTQRAQVEALGERLTKLELDLSAATQARQRTLQAWQDAKEQASLLRGPVRFLSVARHTGQYTVLPA